ncbi:hypothetical protein CIP103987_01105 [Corynebacterium diphtheriae]|nr:hypothetical protein CIP103987_01105 [Corynebacterium diphtheriae]CAB0551693.1 hypothetical protein CIP107526_01101 [Corynebacterium diphtheriae]
MKVFPVRFSAVRIRRVDGATDELGNVQKVDQRETVAVAGWSTPQSDEPVLAEHARRAVELQLFAPSGVFESGDAVELPDRKDALEVIGEPRSFEANPFGWAPSLVVVDLGGIK